MSRNLSPWGRATSRILPPFTIWSRSMPSVACPSMGRMAFRINNGCTLFMIGLMASRRSPGLMSS